MSLSEALVVIMIVVLLFFGDAAIVAIMDAVQHIPAWIH